MLTGRIIIRVPENYTPVGKSRRALEDQNSLQNSRVPRDQDLTLGMPWLTIHNGCSRVENLTAGLESHMTMSAGAKKGDVELPLEEFRRQGRLTSEYLEVGNLWAAANVMREWVISAGIFHSGDRSDWLKLKRRELVGKKLGARSYWNERDFLKEALSPQQRELIKLWDGITQRRNVLAHAGMTEKTPTSARTGCASRSRS